MPILRTPIAGIVLIAGIGISAAAFGVLNWRWLDERNALEREGIAAVGQIEEATISHKACNSSVLVSWTDTHAVRHSKHFMTCVANRSAGQAISVLYLPDHPETAMIADRESGLPNGQFRTGMLIGAIVSAIMSATTVHLALLRIRSDPKR